VKALRIVSNTIPNQYFCKNCSKAHNALIKINNQSFCDECVPEQFKDKLVTVNQNREEI
jgi:hypothetical protein